MICLVSIDCDFYVIDSQLDDMWMSEELKVLNLSFDFPHDIKTADLLPVEDLHGNFMSC